jgi:hypothetical protein
MTAFTLTKAPVVPELDRPDAAQIGDEILLASAASVKLARVSGVRNGRQSADSRAWTKSGNVD